jgi:FixJ family two-component response regulator
MLDSVFEPASVPLATLANRPPGPHHYRRSAATVSDRQAQGELPLSSLWAQLALGTLEIVDDFVTLNRCYVMLRPRKARQLRASEQRGIEVLKRVLLEGCQKVVSYELKLAPSSVTQLSRTGLSLMGLRCRVQSVPYLLVAAAHASDDNASAVARSSLLHYDESALQVLSIARPDADMAELLSPAVLQVTRSLIEGKERSLIACDRRTSERTVANQLAFAFKQLHATSRLDLLRILAKPTRPRAAAAERLRNFENRLGQAEDAYTNA